MYPHIETEAQDDAKQDLKKWKLMMKKFEWLNRGTQKNINYAETKFNSSYFSPELFL
jgi:hypothetical protein